MRLKSRLFGAKYCTQYWSHVSLVMATYHNSELEPFVFLGSGLAQIFGQIVSIGIKILSNYK